MLGLNWKREMEMKIGRKMAMKETEEEAIMIARTRNDENSLD